MFGAVRALSGFINHSLRLKFFLFLVEKQSRELRHTGGHLKIPQGMWYQVVIWWGAYNAAWNCFDDIESLLKSRWESAQLWIDESRGALHRFAAILLPGDYLNADERKLLDLAVVEGSEIERQMAALNDEWLSEHKAAINRTRVDGVQTGTAYDEEWTNIEQRISAQKQALSNRGQAIDLRFRGHKYGLRLINIPENPNWSIDFDLRLAAVESCTSTLFAIPSKENKGKAAQSSYLTDNAAPAVILDKRKQSAIVNGKPKSLRKLQCKVIDALINARPTGLTLESLNKLCGDPRGIVKRMREKDTDWAEVIHMAENSGGRYSID